MIRKFRLFEDQLGMSAGEYDVIRLFDSKRVLVQVNPAFSPQRQITIIPLELGELL